MRCLRTGAVLVVLLVVAGCGAGGLGAKAAQDAAAAAPRACGTSTKPPAKWRHVIWIWMENRSYDQIVGSSSAPFLTSLAHRCGLATNYVSVAHPSLPNYIAATSGGTWGIADDNVPAAHPLAHTSIFEQVAARGLKWRSYEESMPSNCDSSSAGAYAVKHNPAAYYTRIRSACRKWDVPMGTTTSGAFLAALRTNRLPSFSFVTPNVCDDMHSCSVSTGDAWLRQWVSKIVASRDYRAGTTVLFVTFDEGSGGSNRVMTLVVSPTTRRGTRARARFSHYSLLKTTEQLLGIPAFLGHAGDASTASMRHAFHLSP